MSLLHYLSYATIVAAFAFMTLSLASGLLYISELIEEHSRLSKLVGQRATYAIITLHILLYVIDSLPLPQTLFSIICHIVYLQNFSTRWPLISLSSASFIASCAMAITNHFLWFIYFSRVTRDAKQSYTRHRGTISDAPGFTDITTFFGTCVWLVPLFLFLSLSANDNALPTSSGTFHTLVISFVSFMCVYRYGECAFCHVTSRSTSIEFIIVQVNVFCAWNPGI
ncbi:hypothetical protein PAXRUDRAFT_514846 [Paxillus rubicundulus Ve08.2h10]|uniref:DUF396-domain-containing protein n=1 Tax=Paxillus rubicundulus Ve08.2h10 TaxID=930991 RepID=A0A0D0E6S7_9AGAM|nr:hypothetical protein PAXRUDRAFT_514846 [Paxillus rubicundulus Ve08.2h10]